MANHGTPLTAKNLKKLSGTVVLNIPEINNISLEIWETMVMPSR